MRRNRRWTGMLMGAVATAALAVIGPVAARAAPAPGTMGSAEGIVREASPRADGQVHVDTPGTIARLQALHANTYQYLVEASTDWADLSGEFMPAAQQAGIAVIVYLLPPSECPQAAGGPTCGRYVPDEADYDHWGQDVARLSARYPKLVAWTVDDMDFNLSTFTPAYVAMIRSDARAIAPGLDLYLQIYEQDITASLVSSYQNAMDGMIMPFLDAPNRNTEWAGTLQSQLDQVTGLLAPAGKRLVVMLYANTLSNAPVPPDVDYVRAVTSTALAAVASGEIAGVIQWNLDLTAGHTATNAFDRARSGSGRLSLALEPNFPSQVGYHADASATVTLSPGSSSCQLVAWTADDRDSTSPAGYHFKQVLAGSTVLWDQDVTADGTSYAPTPSLDLTSFLAGGPTTLTLRLLEKKAASNYEVDVSFDDLQLTGCTVSNPTFESAAGWTLSRSSGFMLPGIDLFDANHSGDVFATVASLY